MILDCAHYKDGARQHAGPLPLAEAAPSRRGDGFVWLGLHDPDDDELRDVAARFELPDLAVEDSLHAHQRPKLEDYGDVHFLVVHTARYLDDVEEVEYGYPACLLALAVAGFVLHRVLRRAGWL